MKAWMTGLAAALVSGMAWACPADSVKDASAPHDQKAAVAKAEAPKPAPATDKRAKAQPTKVVAQAAPAR